MTTSSKMTSSIDKGLNNGLPASSTRSLSMISIFAIAVGMVAAPAQAQDIPAPDIIPPVQAPPVASPQPVPAANPTISPTIAMPQAGRPPAVEAAPAPQVTPEQADELARQGGFDAETVAPEALVQIEKEQLERQAAADAAAAKAASVRASSSRANVSATEVPAQNPVAEPVSYNNAAVSEAVGLAAPVAATSAFQPAPEITATPDVQSSEPGADWGLLAALAALLGIGGAGAYAASRRRNKDEAAMRGTDPVPASPTAIAVPDERRNSMQEEIAPAGEKQRIPAATPFGSRTTTSTNFATFVGTLSSFKMLTGKPDRNVPLGQRRVAAAPKPYLAQADLQRTAGYFTANVDAMPTPQNPFLTRKNRLKRARFLDGKLAALNALSRESRPRISGGTEVTRSLEPAFS
ncbi:hypothetical protein [Sphingorhabdus sp. 109]|jgi:hypothetical protein|uniref:hypothetical protein n=1 Tax=Sphingorhabdus sp. 109 TaxID=2653173 RepID=UPI0012F297ED|nr:hypothetical protein [Sphingorhabdus sp. 109]VWX56169.1 conserved hypothetical protein [Sphingorhabdus sp. 109]